MLQGTLTTFRCSASEPRVVCSRYRTGQPCSGDSGRGASIYDFRKNFGFFTPSPLVTYIIHAASFLLSAFWGPPLPPPLRCGRHIRKPPSSMVAARNGDGVWVLYGVNSFGTMNRCNSLNGYDGSTDVSAWTDQIMGIVNDMGQG